MLKKSILCFIDLAEGERIVIAISEKQKSYYLDRLKILVCPKVIVKTPVIVINPPINW